MNVWLIQNITKKSIYIVTLYMLLTGIPPGFLDVGVGKED